MTSGAGDEESSGDTDVLAGVRVVELSSYAFAPAAGAVLADWGADVVRIVRPGVGDPMLGNPVSGMDDDGVPVAYMWEILNRGKRTIGIDLATPEARPVVADLIGSADVFLTSLLPAARRRLALDVDDVRAINPRIVYARASANGPRGPESGSGGFDATSFWARSGLADAAHAVSGTHTQPAMAMGDLCSGANLAAAVVAALFRRERTGRTAVVDVSLLSSGIWMQSASIVASSLYDVDRLPFGHSGNPLVAIYRCGDGNFVSVAALAGDGAWQDLCTAAGRPDLLADQRFATLTARLAHREECVAVLDELFAGHAQADWVALLDGSRLPAAPVRTAHSVPGDPMVRANGYVREVTAGGRTFVTTATPAQFDEAPLAVRPAPAWGAETEQVLLELGRSWDDIAALKAVGAVL